MDDVTAFAEWPPRWAVMWLAAFAIFFACKRLTWQNRGAVGVPVWKHVAYFAAWPGLDADAFLAGTAPPPRLRETLFAASKLALGVAVLWGVLPRCGGVPTLVRGWIGMAGLVFVLHFGSFHLLSCAWRSVGVAARPLMDWPVAAESVGGFWGRRWNVAFRDVAHRFLFRPLTARLGPRGALAAGFLFSGLVHELVVTVPAGGGYGGPTAYFLTQAAALLAERSGPGRAVGLGRGLPGRLFTAAAVVGPAPLLFPHPFVGRVVVPFLQTIGAW